MEGLTPMKIATYVELPGTTAEAIAFYQNLFNATLIRKELFADYMTSEPSLIGKVFHAELELNGFYLYFSDSLAARDFTNQAYKITMECDSLEQANSYFNALKLEGTVNEEFKQMPWGMYHGIVRDRFGLTWDIVFC